MNKKTKFLKLISSHNENLSTYTNEMSVLVRPLSVAFSYKEFYR